MKNITLLSLLFFCLPIAASAQHSVSDNHNTGTFKYQNSISFEAGGHGLVYSINYECNIINTRFYKLSQQVGLALYPAIVDIRSNIWIPYSVNQLFSYRQHHLETGVGVVLTQNDNSSNTDGFLKLNKGIEFFYSAKVGYRYQKPNGRMTYKALFTPLWEKSYGFTEFHPLGAFSIGYNF